MNEQKLEQLWKQHSKISIKEQRKPRHFFQRLSHKFRIAERLFNFFEKHLKRIESDGSSVLVTEKLSSDVLNALIIENTVCAVHIPNFCPADVADSLSNSALDEYTQWKLGGVVSTDMFFAGGSIPREVADNNASYFYRYFSEREDFVSKQRSLSGGRWPVDQLRLDLDQSWQFGACLGHYLEQKLRPAIMRIMQEENGLGFSSPDHGFIHTDDFPKLHYSRGTFTANIYLKVPEEGGELYIWNINFNRIKGFYHYLTAKILSMILFTQQYTFSPKWQAKIIKLLPKPQVIKPKKGDLVIFHSGRPHSVAPVKGARVTNQLFIFVKGNTPLTIGS